MKGKSWVELSSRILKCSQKELAIKMNVSPTQITKWKNDEYMSYEIQKRFEEITGLAKLEISPEEVLLLGSIENASKWQKLVKYIADYVMEDNETGMTCEPLVDDINLLSVNTLEVFNELGIDFPNNFPEELDVTSTELYEHSENFFKNKFASTIMEIFISLQNLYGFYSAYFYNDLMSNEMEDWYENRGMDFETCLLELAVTKVSIDPSFAPNIHKFNHEWIEKYQDWIDELKNELFVKGIPIKAELTDLIKYSDDEVGHEAEAYSLGFTKSRVHPDIYMNELLIGMRAIHRVLPKIAEKLKIKLDKIDWN
tara:strand:+ start:247 stop:1182 length:936 start_codon:yes stop_codon:yes gene_type:complete